MEASNPSPSTNPYAASTLPVERPGDLAESWFGSYRPVVMPRDFIDSLFGLVIGVVIAVAVYGIPLLILAWLEATPFTVAVVFLSVVGLGFVAIAVGIRKVELNEEGIVLRRGFFFASQRKWNEVLQLRPAGRLEVLWTTAVKPHRCCSYSMTSTGQIVLETLRGHFMFPPENVAVFCETVKSQIDTSPRQPGSC